MLTRSRFPVHSVVKFVIADPWRFIKVEFSDLNSGRPVTPQTRFRIGSVSKTLTATALGFLLKERKLYMDADVREYVPEFPDKGYPITRGGHGSCSSCPRQKSYWPL